MMHEIIEVKSSLESDTLLERHDCQCILYSAKFLWVFNFANFVNFQLFVKIFQQNFLTRGVQCVRAANLIFSTKFSKIAIRENLDPENLVLYSI